EARRRRQDALRRAETKARPRRRPCRRPPARLPRRAHDRLRPRGAPRRLGDDPLAALTRQDGPPHDPLPRRGAAARRPGGRAPGGTDRHHGRSVGAHRRLARRRDPLPPKRGAGRAEDGRADPRAARADRGGAGSRRRARGPGGEATDARGRLPVARPGGGAVRMFLHQLRFEQLLFWRSREAAFFIFGFPLLLFVLLGSVYNGKIDGYPASSVLLVGVIGYGAAIKAFAGTAIL